MLTTGEFFYNSSDENLASFFRRPTFSPDGAILVTPAGIGMGARADDQNSHGFYVYARGQLNR